jgi:hypothetical protein
MGPKAGLDVVEYRKILARAGNRTPAIQFVACRYTGSPKLSRFRSERQGEEARRHNSCDLVKTCGKVGVGPMLLRVLVTVDEMANSWAESCV